MQGSCMTETFCDMFSQVYDLEVDYKQLSEEERAVFRDLSDIASRYSDNDEDLKIPNVFFDEASIKEKVKEISLKLGVKTK